MATELLAMPPDDSVRVHDDQRGSPMPPRVDEHHQKESISTTEFGTFRGALEYRQLLTESQILKRDRSVSTADQGEIEAPRPAQPA